MFDNFWSRLFAVVEAWHVFLWDAFQTTMLIAFMAFVLGLAFGALLAVVRAYPSDHFFAKILKWITGGYVLLFRGTPLLVQLLIWFFVILQDSAATAVTVAIIGFTFDGAAYMSETIRGSINAIDKGQMEAGRALGLSTIRTYSKVILPQAFKTAVPQLGNELIAMVKSTSIVGVIGVMDLRIAIDRINLVTFDIIVGFLLLAMIYLVVVYLLTLLIKFFEKVVFAND